MSGGLGDRLAGKRVCIVAGSGGVGKTTTSAAIALGLAARGARVGVVTIDPARRLAQALGLDELDNEPRPVAPEVFEAAGLPMKGELRAMMLDAKRTFDELIERLAPDERTRDEILANRIYQQLSGAVAGSQEFTAIAKLYDLDREGGFDVLVLDTPPSRNALDFLDAPDRLTGFLEGRALKMFLAPTGIAAKLVGRSTGVVFSVLERVTGVDLLRDLSAFFRALGGVLDGFTERAAGVKALLADPGTTFVVVTSPQPEPAEEALYFHGKLAEARMPFGALVVNRLTPRATDVPVDVDGLAGELAGPLGDGLARKVARTFADEQEIAARDAASVERLCREMGVADPVLVPVLDGAAHDAEGLVAIERHLFADDAERERLLACAAGLDS